MSVMVSFDTLLFIFVVGFVVGAFGSLAIGSALLRGDDRK